MISRCVPKISSINEADEAMTRSGTGLPGVRMARTLKQQAIMTNAPKLKIRKGKLSSIFHRMVHPLSLTATHRLYKRVTVQTSVTIVISKAMAQNAKMVIDNHGD